jgi:hypothetical protein
VRLLVNPVDAILAWWRDSLRFVPSYITCNKAKTRRGLASGASSDTQVSWKCEREKMIIYLDGMPLKWCVYIGSIYIYIYMEPFEKVCMRGMWHGHLAFVRTWQISPKLSFAPIWTYKHMEIDMITEPCIIKKKKQLLAAIDWTMILNYWFPVVFILVKTQTPGGWAMSHEHPKNNLLPIFYVNPTWSNYIKNYRQNFLLS